MKPTKTKPDHVQSNLAAWLQDERSDQFFSQAFRVKFAVLAELSAGNSRRPAAEIARRFGITRAAVGVHVRAARRIYGFTKPTAKKSCRS